MKATSSVRLCWWGVALAVTIGAGALAASASGAEVQACIGRSDPLDIGSDPAACAAGSRVSAISVKFGFTAQTDPNAKVQPGPLVLVKRLDETSPRLFLDATSIRPLKSVLVVVFEQAVSTDGSPGGRGRRLFSFLLDDALITGLEDSAQEGVVASLSPLEVVAFAYARVTLRDDVSGELSCFDFKTLKAC
jgi:type VI protein secretion system component Hcp